MLSVNGIGPNTAIMILSGSTVDDIKRAVINEDAKSLEKIKGVGKKTAERIILELKETIKEITTSISTGMDAQQKGACVRCCYGVDFPRLWAVYC